MEEFQPAATTPGTGTVEQSGIAAAPGAMPGAGAEVTAKVT